MIGRNLILSEVFNNCLYFSYDPIDNVRRFIDLLGIKAENTLAWRVNVTNKLQKIFPIVFRYYYRIKSNSIQLVIKFKKTVRRTLFREF